MDKLTAQYKMTNILQLKNLDDIKIIKELSSDDKFYSQTPREKFEKSPKSGKLEKTFSLNNMKKTPHF